MTAAPFDTLKFAERLEMGGFTPQQARAAAEAFAEATSQELATKTDLRELEVRITANLYKALLIQTFAIAGLGAALVKLL